MDDSSPWPLLIAFFGIPAAGMGAILFDLEIPRLIYGHATPLFLATEIGSLGTLFALFLLLRSRLALPSAPSGLVRDVLDFLAVARWHAAVKLALAGLLILPLLWFALGNKWMLTMFASLGRRALQFTDVQNSLDGAAVAYQHALIGGVPLLFMFHMLCRWKRKSRILPWLLVPMFFVGTAVAVIISVTMAHFGD
ncbi:MAG TPA: hypothetical protein VKT29_03660 [Terriglobales bacterium]|nr:hypothetical protein [Terriglobales bacterium]